MLSNERLDEIEECAYNTSNYRECLYLCDLLNEYRNLKHEMTNPNYLYAGTRINRQAFLCRNEQIDNLFKEIIQAKGEINEVINTDHKTMVQCVKELKKYYQDTMEAIRKE